MKNKCILLFILLVLMVSGCTKKKELVCKKIDKGLDSSTESNYIVKFEDEKVSKIIIQEVVTLTADYVNYIDPYIQSAQAAAKEYKKHDGFTAKSSKAKDTVTLTVEATTSKMSDEDKTQYNVNMSYDEYKLELEGSDYGYTCE